MTPVVPPDHALAVGGRVPRAVAEALAEARRIRDAWAHALEQAVAEAREAAAEETRDRLRRSLRALHHWAGRERVRLAEEARSLALALAQQVVARPLEPAALPPILSTGRWLVVRLHPTDAASLVDVPEGIETIADPALAPGDVILEGPAGRVDARAATRLQRVLAGAEGP